MKIAVAQISCVPGEAAANLNKVHEYAARAQSGGAELIVFPEMVDTGYAMSLISKHASAWTEGPVPRLQEIARSLSMAVICGVSERDASAVYNAQVCVDASGEIMAKYRKTHLFTPPPLEEHRCFSPGTGLTTFAFQGFRLGLSICYDLRFPEVYRSLAATKEVNVFVISSAWPFPRVEHFQTLCLARAVENQSYLIAANRVGTDEGVTFCGSSTIIDPYGMALATGSTEQEELLQAEIFLERITAVRRAMPVFQDRRTDLYA